MNKPGKESTEHARAWRAEVLGVLLVAAGLLLHDHALCAIGAALVAVTTTAYSFARGGSKAAAARPAAVHAQPRV